MRKKKIILNAVAGLTLQILTIAYGFIVPKLIMTAYGSSVNGLLHSITQFLSYIALLDAGVSAVIRAKLYKPLANNDRNELQGIINTSVKFYRKIALSYIGVLFIVAVIIPTTYLDYFDKTFSFLLVLIVGASTFAEYYFGITYTVLLEADQRKYIVYCIQCITVILNTLLSFIFIKSGFSIHIVKLITSFLFIAKPLFLFWFCSRRYALNRCDTSIVPISNKWSGLGHHIAFFLHSHTDVIILTFAQGPYIVSVYSVYNMIVVGLRQMLTYLSGGVEAAFGNMLAKGETDKLKKGLNIYELLVFSSTTIFFTTAAVTILDFVRIYTKGVTDVEYIVPHAAMTLIFAEAVYCIRRPYESLVMASGKLKETMAGAFLEAGLNVGISLVLVWHFSIVGVALGTLIAMLFRTLQYMLFASKHIVVRSPVFFYFKLTVFLVCGILIISGLQFVALPQATSYTDLLCEAIIVLLISTCSVIAVDFIFFKPDLLMFCNMLKTMLYSKKRNN